MILKNEESLCLSSRVHDALKDANKDSVGEMLSNLISQGELVTLKQLLYYTEELGLRLDLLSNHIALCTPSSYLVHQIVGWCDEHILIVNVKPLRDCLRNMQAVCCSEDDYKEVK